MVRDAPARRRTGRRALPRSRVGMLAVMCSLVLAGDLVAQDVGISLGARPPAAVVEDMDGNAVNLAQLIGTKPVLIEFWATWCPLCEALMPRMLAAQRRYGSQAEFVVVGVGVNQSRATMRRHLERHPMPFQFFYDADGAAVRAFQAPSTSYVVVLDAGGRVVYTGIGEDQDIEAAVSSAVAHGIPRHDPL